MVAHSRGSRQESTTIEPEDNGSTDGGDGCMKTHAQAAIDAGVGFSDSWWVSQWCISSRGASMLASLVVLPLLQLMLSSAAVSSCPSSCSCKWKNGKEWVECAGRGLQGLPQGAREETQVLDLSGNQLLGLANDCFFVLRLVNLQRLYLSRSRIRGVAAGAFTGLQGLVELDLADNELDEVPTATFAAVPNLMRLNLAGNPVRSLQHQAFLHLGQLTMLDLSRCWLRRLEPTAFAGLHALEWLRLNDNLLATLPDDALPLPQSLHGLPLHGNPWLCDCRLQDLRKWLLASQIQAPQEAEPSCAEPTRLKGRAIRALKPQELACVPKLVLPERIELYEGENATLLCEVRANPSPVTLWLFNGELLDPHQEPTIIDNKIRYVNPIFRPSSHCHFIINVLVYQLGNFLQLCISIV